MPEPGPTVRPAPPPRRGPSLLGALATLVFTFRRGALLVATLATLVFVSGLRSEPSFVDEWAYLSQTYYADLWLAGKADHAAWLDYPAYDLPPLPKYVFGLALRAGGYRRPAPEAARRWYRNTASRAGNRGMLDAARRPVVAFGVLGCLAVYGLGTLAADRRVGFLAALFLMMNPLYRLHARRAMSDVMSESLILLAALAALWAWTRMLAGRRAFLSWIGAAASGVAAGLAALAKLNGALAMMIVGAWAVLAVLLPRVPPGRKLAVALAALLAGVLSLATFARLNPFVTANPRGTPASPVARQTPAERLRTLVRHRVAVSSGQQEIFPHNALTTPLDKLATVAVQGFGRFGPLGPRHSDSTRRFELSQDWGAVAWLPLVLAGVFVFLGRGRRQLDRGEPPAAWAILLQATVAAIVVAAYLPLAWDRYYLSLQPGSALLAAGALVAAAEGLTHRTSED